MADPAAQSPFVSSSSSARPEPAGPACRGMGAASCADPLVSSSQPVSLFAASPAVSGGGPPPPREAFIPLSSSSSSSSSSPGGGAEPPRDSPGSPFELVLDREYPGGGALSERGGALSQIPEDRICDFPAKPPPAPRGSRLPSQTSIGFPVTKFGAPPSQNSGGPPPGTAAALEEVSKCVREMHSFTSEMLSWDWVERGDGPPPGDDGPPPGEEGPPRGEGPPPRGDGPPPGDADSSGDSDDTVIEEPPPAQRGPSGGVPPPGVDVGPPRFEISSSSSSSSSSAPPRLEIAPPGGTKIAAPPRPSEAELKATQEPPPRPPRACWLPALTVQDLVLWRDPRLSGAVFGASLALLLSLAAFSAVSVGAHAALALLCGTVSYRVYRAVVCALQKADEGHPFRAYLELDLTLSPETFQSHAAAAMTHINHGLRLLLRLFLVEDLVDSLKLAVAMWLLTHVGAVFNGITLLILADLLAFTVPPFYEKYKAQIDHYVNMAREQSKSLVEKVQAKVPGMAKKKPE